ncbi:hypothetical protein [Streptomyces sp. CT34]|uniref:hypothetical protein n=1 Tax=Streptomyces sp. CT34 TaxID=1553907 RepID=UPI0012FF43E2|nr:hypothetical protein [Streptomyces sp. CT34]
MSTAVVLLVTRWLRLAALPKTFSVSFVTKHRQFTTLSEAGQHALLDELGARAR